MSHEFILDDEGNVVEVRVELEDGRIACSGVIGGELRDRNADISDKAHAEIKAALKKKKV